MDKKYSKKHIHAVDGRHGVAVSAAADLAKHAKQQAQHSEIDEPYNIIGASARLLGAQGAISVAQTLKHRWI